MRAAMMIAQTIAGDTKRSASRQREERMENMDLQSIKVKCLLEVS